MRHLLQRGHYIILYATLAMAWSTGAHAGISAPTRVQFSGETDEMSLRLRNPGTQPSLVQAWIDTGDADADPSEIQAPFLITPSVFRAEPGATHALRILFVPGGAAVPQDRESRFYLNLLDIPPAQRASDEASVVNLAVHYRMPLIYRPKGLQQGGRTADGVAGLTWRLRGVDGGTTLEVSNPSPYHVSLRQLVVERAGTAEQRRFAIGEILPRSTAVFQSVENTAAQPGQWTVRYTATDENGYDLEGNASVSQRTENAS